MATEPWKILGRHLGAISRSWVELLQQKWDTDGACHAACTGAVDGLRLLRQSLRGCTAPAERQLGACIAQRPPYG